MKQATGAAIQTQGPRSLDARLGRKMSGIAQSAYRKCASRCAWVVALIAILCALTSVAHAATNHTTTTLAVTPGNSVAAGSPVTLTSTVTFTTSLTSGFVTAGTVVFCNGNAKGCEDAAIIGTAQLTNAGTATIKVTLGVGTHSIFAAYQQDVFPGSVSAKQTVTVTPNASYLTSISIAASTPPSPFALTGTVAAFGTAPPTGTVSFTQTSDRTIVGSQALNPATLGFTFLTATGSPVPVGFEPEISVLGDFNNDGILDIAVANNATNAISILLGNPNGTFQSPTTFLPSSFGALSIAVGDFNRDGNLDLAVVIPGDGLTGDGTGTVNILLGNGDGTFQPQQTYVVGNGPDSIAMADFNGDGFLDLAVLNNGDKNVSVLLGVGDGTFALEQTCFATFVPGTHPEGAPICATATFPVGNNPVQIATADFNVDGFPDLVVTDGGDSTVTILQGVGDGTFLTGTTIPVGNGVSDVVVADFNGDGFEDFAVTNQGDNSVTVLLGLGNGSFPSPMRMTYSVGRNPIGIAVGDFNGDGSIDLAVSNIEDNSVGLLLNKADGTGTFQPQVAFPAGGLPLRISVGDLNGDGIPDLVAINAEPFVSKVFVATILLAAQTESATATGVVISGMQNIVASYPGDTVHAASESTSAPVGLVATTTTLSVLPNPALAGQAVTFTATVAPPPTGTPLGTVGFFNGATMLGSVTVNDLGVAVFTTSSLPNGVLSLTAVYSGNAGFGGSTSTVHSVTVGTQTVTTTTLSVAPNPATTGQAVTFTATVTPAPTGAPLGMVSFHEGITLLGTATVNALGVATFTTSSLTAGTSGFTASFSGNAGFAGSISTVQSVTVSVGIRTTSTLTPSPNPATAGQPVTFTLTVTPAPTGTPLGTVNFFNGATLLGMATLNSAGVATFTSSTLPSGTDVITAVFSGNAGSAGSTSAPVSLVINPTYAITGPTMPVTLAARGSVNININVAPVGSSFTSLVTMSASGLPAGATATFNPPSVTPGAAGATTVMTVTLSANAKLVSGPGKNQAFALFGLAVAGMCLFVRKRKPAKSWAVAFACTALMCGMLVIPGCGTTGSGTKSQTVIVTVTGTSGAVHQSTMVTLILK